MPDTQEVYPLSRDANESERLRTQHDIHTASIGYLLHPSIPVHPNMRIADVATGNGIWLIDLAKQLPPTCSFTGFDISPDQFPPPSSLPSNMTFHEQDLLKPFPAQYLGAFDVVAVRLIVLALRHGQWHSALRSLLTLLKPGGYLQWVDISFDNTRVVALQEGARTDYLARLDDMCLEAARARAKDEGADPFGATTLHALFREEKLEDCEEDVVACDRAPGTAEANGMNSLIVQERFMKAAGMKGYDEALEGARREIEGGKAVWRYFLYSVVGRKPGDGVVV